MDFESTISSIGGNLSTEIENAVSFVGDMIPSRINLSTMLHFLLYFAAGSLILGILGRVILGKRSSLNHSLSSAVGILFVYAATIVLYTFQPWDLDRFLSPLPFVNFYENYIVLFPFSTGDVSAWCSAILSLILLAFLVNLLDTFLPKGKNIVTWYILRILTVFLSIVLHYFSHWAIHTYLPESFAKYSPIILLLLLIGLLFLGVLNLILSVALTVVDPLFGAVYAFFFSNIIGKQLTKAVFSGIVIGIVFYLMDTFGYTAIAISPDALVSYAPLLAVLLVLWYLIGHLL